MLSEARQKKIMEKLNRAQKCSILGPQNLGSRGGPGPRAPLDPHLCSSEFSSKWLFWPFHLIWLWGILPQTGTFYLIIILFLPPYFMAIHLQVEACLRFLLGNATRVVSDTVRNTCRYLWNGTEVQTSEGNAKHWLLFDGLVSAWMRLEESGWKIILFARFMNHIYVTFVSSVGCHLASEALHLLDWWENVPATSSWRTSVLLLLHQLKVARRYLLNPIPHGISKPNCAAAGIPNASPTKLSEFWTSVDVLWYL